MIRVFSVLVLWFFVAQPLVARPTLDQLLESGKLQIKTWISPESDIVTGQQITLNIEVSTTNWFTGGTRIKRFEIANAILLRRNQFATNSTKHIKGVAYAVQLWTMEVFSQRPGSITIPSIELELSIAGVNGTSITGTLQTERITFSTQIPSALQGTPEWIASSQFKILDSWEPDIDEVLVGDSVRRNIELIADDVPAMMLPLIKMPTNDHVASYRQPANVQDRSNRGQSVASRQVTIDYVFEQPGAHTIPGVTFYWWDLGNKRLKTLVLKEKIFIVGGEVTNTDSADFLSPLLYFLAVIALVLLGYLLYVIANHCLRFFSHWRVQRRKDLHRQFANACRCDDHLEAIRLLYRWFDHHKPTDSSTSIRQFLLRQHQESLLLKFDSIMAKAYSGKPVLIDNIESFLEDIRPLFFQPAIDKDRPGLN